MARKKGKASRRGNVPVSRQAEAQQLEQMIRSRTGEEYPPEGERQKIIDRRFELVIDLIKGMATYDDAHEGVADLMAQHNQRDVMMAANFIEKNLTHASILVEEASIYGKYRRAYARWGGTRPFFQRAPYEELSSEYFGLVARRESAPMQFGPGKRERELRDLLVLNSELWSDIIPPAAPQRPADFAALPTGAYGAPVDALLALGPEPDRRQVNKLLSQNRPRWQAAIPDLRRMALDEGLLAGWPGESASWAPEHALEMLRLLKVSDHLAELVELSALADRPEDWLSDKLPEVWAAAGPGMEDLLAQAFANTTYSLLRRMTLLDGLRLRAEQQPKLRAGIVRRLTEVLDASPAEAGEVNAYIINMFNEMDADDVPEIVGAAVTKAFEEGRVDEEIIRLEDIDWL